MGRVQVIAHETSVCPLCCTTTQELLSALLDGALVAVALSPAGVVQPGTRALLPIRGVELAPGDRSNGRSSNLVSL